MHPREFVDLTFDTIAPGVGRRGFLCHEILRQVVVLEDKLLCEKV